MAPRWAVLGCAYVGAVVGAGFASGQEILQFFARHGTAGLVGCALAGLLFCLAGTAALHRTISRRHAHYGALLRDICGPWLGGALDRVGALALFVGLAAVVAAAGALGTAEWAWPPWWGSAGLAVVLAASAIGGRAAFNGLNLVAVPLIVACCVAAAWGSGTTPRPPGADSPSLAGTWPISAALYVAYNLLLATAGLCASCDGAERAADGVIGGVVGGVVLGGLCAAVTWTLLHAAHTATAALPLGAAMAVTPWGRIAYPAVLILSLWTTGGAAATALGRRARGPRGAPAAVAAALAALPLALFGLRLIVAHLYPLLGYCGLPLLAALLWPGAGALGKAGRAR